MRLVKLTWKTNWACFLLKDGYFLLLSEYFIAIYPFSLSLSSSVWYGNLYFSRESSILSERSRELAEDPHDFQWNKKCSWAWKSLVLLLQGTDFFSFSPSHFSSVFFFFFWCPKVARLCSAFFFPPATTHAAEILPSALWNCNLLFLFLSQSSSSLLIPEIPSHFGPLL